MLTSRMRRAIGIALFGITPLALPIATAGVAYSHGYTTSPSSRQDACGKGEMKNCGQIQWEPQSVEGPKGFPEAGPKDGALCSGGLGRFSELDEVRDWPQTKVSPGQDLQFTWSIETPHATSKWEYYITKDGWDDSKPLTRAALEPEPFLRIPFNGKQPPHQYQHTDKLPAGKSGHHVIYSVWEIADTGNSFYACSDVNFG